MNVLNVAAPIAIEELKKYFSDKSTFYKINYAESKLTGSKLITYLSNLDLPADVELNGSTEDTYQLIKDYMNSPMLVNIESLEFAVMMILAEAKGLTEQKHHAKFIEENSELVDQWISKLDSLTLYNMYIINSDDTKAFAESFPLDETTDITGVNFISLLKHPEFYSLYEAVDQSKLKFYKNYFNEYMFKGKNLYSFWATHANPLFLLTFGIGSGDVTGEQYINAKQLTIQGMQNVSSI